MYQNIPNARHSTYFPIDGNNSFIPSDMNNNYFMENNDERFFFAPFVVGGLAGTALGYGIANNNQLNNNNNQGVAYVPGYPVYVYPPYPIMYY